MSEKLPSLAYVLQLFPAETFIYREISALRRLGFSIRILASFRPKPEQLSEEALPFIDETFYCFPLSWSSLFTAHLRYLFSRPRRYLGTLVYVLTRPGESLKNRYRTLVHFAYGMVTVRELERLQPQHIHAHFGWSASTIALIANRILGIPFSVTFHAFHTRGSYPQRLLPREKIRRARFVVAISEFHREFLKSFLPENDPGDKIHVIHHGLDPTVFVPSTAPATNTDVFTIVGVGQLIACKGFHVLIDACGHLAEWGIPFRCHILGEGAERAQLERLINQHDLRESVRLPGRVTQQELRAYLDRADVFALPCIKDEHGRQDGLPVVLTEAMAMEVPVVSTRISAIPELIDHERNGLLSQPGDALALAKALSRLEKEPELRRCYGKAGRETVVAEFNIFRSAEQLARLFAAYR